MLTYNKLSRKERSLKSFTGLTINEFEKLHDELLPIWNKRLNRKNRIRRIGGGRKSNLSCFYDELLMILFFYRNYPCYEIIGYLFNLDISNISRHISSLETVLSKLSRLKLAKPRKANKINTVEELFEKFPELTELIGDTTEQPIQRPKKKSKQKKHYSGKKKRHTVKTQLVTNKEKRIYDVSKTYTGRTHDKSIMETERTPDKIPRHSKLRVDNAYQKIQKEYPDNNFILPEKANRWHKLTRKQKNSNKDKASKRIIIEHVISRLKVFKILSEKYRHNVAKHNRTFKNISAIYNFRLDLATLS